MFGGFFPQTIFMVWVFYFLVFCTSPRNPCSTPPISPLSTIITLEQKTVTVTLNVKKPNAKTKTDQKQIRHRQVATHDKSNMPDFASLLCLNWLFWLSWFKKKHIVILSQLCTIKKNPKPLMMEIKGVSKKLLLICCAANILNVCAVKKIIQFHRGH